MTDPPKSEDWDLVADFQSYALKGQGCMIYFTARRIRSIKIVLATRASLKTDGTEIALVPPTVTPEDVQLCLTMRSSTDNLQLHGPNLLFGMYLGVFNNQCKYTKYMIRSMIIFSS